MKTKTTLIGSAGTLEDLILLISERWGWKNIIPEKTGEKTWQLRVNGSVPENLRIAILKKRFRF